MTDRYSRRRLLRSGAGIAAGTSMIGTAAADHENAADLEFRKIPCVDLTDVEDRTRTISPSEPIPEPATGIRPGSAIVIDFEDGGSSGCTANFVWRDTNTVIGGSDEVDDPERNPLYLGSAGHCFLPEGVAGENAKRQENEEVYDLSKVTVRVCDDCTFGGLTDSVLGGDTYELGEVVYARQALPNEDGGEGEEVGSDFGLVRIPEELRPAVDPSMPQFGGPVGEETGAVPAGETVCQFGAGYGGEVFATQGSRGVSQGTVVDDDDDGDGISDRWYAGIRASFGDSGSLLVRYEAGRGTDAAGVITHLAAAVAVAGVGGPTAGTTVTRCAEMPVVDGVSLAPDSNVPEGEGDGEGAGKTETLPELEVVTAGEDVTL